MISEQAAEAIEWSLKKTACEAACAREKIICQIEQIAHIMWSSGEAQQWLEECADEAVKRIAASVNGPLLLRLARLIGYHDTACVDLLRHGEHVHRRLPSSFAFVYFILCSGGQLHGVLHCSNNGTPIEGLPAIEPPMETTANNKLVVERLSEDKYADELHTMCLADVACGRMRGPWMLDSLLYPNSSHLSPRFCVEQGVKESGELKLRAIDDLSFSSLNAATQATEKLRCDTLDGLFEVLRRQTMHSQVRLHARYDAPCRRMRSLHVC